MNDPDFDPAAIDKAIEDIGPAIDEAVQKIPAAIDRAMANLVPPRPNRAQRRAVARQRRKKGRRQ